MGELEFGAPISARLQRIQPQPVEYPHHRKIPNRLRRHLLRERRPTSQFVQHTNPRFLIDDDDNEHDYPPFKLCPKPQKRRPFGENLRHAMIRGIGVAGVLVGTFLSPAVEAEAALIDKDGCPWARIFKSVNYTISGEGIRFENGKAYYTEGYWKSIDQKKCGGIISLLDRVVNVKVFTPDGKYSHSHCFPSCTLETEGWEDHPALQNTPTGLHSETEKQTKSNPILEAAKDFFGLPSLEELPKWDWVKPD